MNVKKAVTLLVVAMGAALVSACASTGPRDGFAKSDAYEPFNRAVHKNNLRADTYVLRPMAIGYELVTPDLFQHLIRNGLNHLDLTTDFDNYLMQGDIDRGLSTFGRFTLNTIVGAGGLLDPATEFGLPEEDTDFGMTLARHGVGEGSYLVLPLLGPTTIRDSFGFLVDRAFSPSTYFGVAGIPGYVSPSLTVTDFVDRRNRNADLIDDVLYGSEDSYVTLRAAFLQRRRALIAGEERQIDALPDIFDDEAPQN